MSNVKRLEDALRADPDNVQLDAHLRAELRDQLGFSAEEVDAHVTYIVVMAHRARLLGRAAELLRSDSPQRGGLVHSVRVYCGMAATTATAIHITTDGTVPTVEARSRTVAGEDWTVVIRVPALWLIRTAAEMQAPVPRARHRRRGNP